MGLYRDETGRLIEVDDKFAEARGYVPSDPGEGFGGRLNAEAAAARGEERGLLGDVNATLTGIASGMTLGGSDYLLGQTLTPLERERVLAEIEAHPYLHTGGEILGGVAGAFATPGSALTRTPAGYLSSLAAREVETNLARGGIASTAKAIGVMGIEGAAQSGGQYIGHSALEDKETTVEGLAGALGTGFEFGSIGGGAALGIAKGTMAARRLYSRVMDGRKAAKDAESMWSLANQEALDADTANMRAAETELNDIGKAKVAAQRYRNTERAAMQEEANAARAMAQEAGPAGETQVSQTSSAEAFVGPEPLVDVGPQSGAGGVTSAYKRPEAVTFDPADAAAFDAGMPSMRDQVNDLAGTIKPAKDGAKTGAFERPTGSTARYERPVAEPTSELETQLAGTKAKLDEGAALRDVVPEDQIHARVKEMQRQGRTKEGMIADAKARTAETLSEIRYKATEDLLGAAVAKREQALRDAFEELKTAHADTEHLAGFGPVSDGVPLLEGRPSAQKTVAGSPGGRRAVEILDDAHEEALLRARHALDPAEAGKAVSEAHELEKLLDGISDGVPHSVDDFSEQLADEVKKLWRREQASAKLADELGDAAHPSSTMRAKGLRDAEKDAERKVFDRTTRAVDDAESFGPVIPRKQRVDRAGQRVAELTVDEKEARGALAEANKKVKIGEKAKKAALREDAKAAAAASKLGAQDLGGVLEMLDLPGLPKPSDLPIVGPLLGAYLKFRTLKRALGRFAGRVEATGNNRVAALANQTRDRIARAVDRSLGVLERGAKTTAKIAPAAAGILAARIYDDGGENPPKNAPIQKLAAARMREINAYVTTPGAIELDVRRELRDVADPDIIAAAEKQRRVMMEYMQRVMPKVPEQGLLHKVDWEPSPAEAMSFARRLDALSDPAGVYERLAHEQAMLSLEAAQVMRDVYPKLFMQAQQRILERASEGQLNVPRRTRIQMAVLYQMPSLEPSLDPANFQITQSVYDKKPSSPAYNPAAPGAAPAAPPTAAPSIANPVDVSQAYMPSYDRR